MDNLISHSEHHLFWIGITGKDRYQAIQEIEDCVSHFGFISEFKQFSDLDMNICIEVETAKVNDLFKALQSVIHLEDNKSDINLKKVNQVVYLHLSFLKGKGNLTTEVPAVPG